MLKYNFSRMMRIRGVVKPNAFLMKNGFSHMLAHKIVYDKADRISLAHLEKMCKLFNCTPNDFIDWIPEPGEDRPDVALSKLKSEYKSINIADYVRQMPLEQLNELAKIIAEKKGK